MHVVLLSIRHVGFTTGLKPPDPAVHTHTRCYSGYSLAGERTTPMMWRTCRVVTLSRQHRDRQAALPSPSRPDRATSPPSSPSLSLTTPRHRRCHRHAPLLLPSLLLSTMFAPLPSRRAPSLLLSLILLLLLLSLLLWAVSAFRFFLPSRAHQYRRKGSVSRGYHQPAALGVAVLRCALVIDPHLPRSSPSMLRRPERVLLLPLLVLLGVAQVIVVGGG